MKEKDQSKDQLFEGRELPDWMDIVHLSSISSTSVRLRHAFTSARCLTLGDFLRLGIAGRRAIRNYGQKCEEELRSLVLSLARDESAPLEGHNVGCISSNGNFVVDRVRYEKLCKLQTPWLMISESEWSHACAAAASRSDWRLSEVALKIGCTWPSNALLVTVESYLTRSLDEIWNLPRMGRVKMRTVVLSVIYLAYFAEDDRLERIDDILSLPIFGELDSREKLILNRRLLVPEPRQMTLDEAGRSQSITRERIRQIERDLLLRIRESRSGTRILGLLEKEKREVFLRLAKGEQVLTESTLCVSELEFGGAHLLAIYLEGRSLRGWLSANFLDFGGVWFSGTKDEWDVLERRLKSWRSDQLPLPESVIAGSSNVTVREARAYFTCSGKAYVYRGYILPSSKVLFRRAVGLHSFLCAEGLSGRDPLVVASKYEEVSGVPNFKNRARHGYRAIVSTPTLFLSSSSTVVSIHSGEPWRGAPQEDEFEADENNHCNRIESAISDYINRTGPCSLVAVVEYFLANERMGIRSGSVVAVLTQSQEFIRLAPGLYDLQAIYNASDRLVAGRLVLLNEKDVRRYCFARYTGEDVSGLFPLWDFEQEKIWATRGPDFLSSGTLDSLLSVSDPSSWPDTTEGEITKWNAVKAKSVWRLKVSWSDDLPSDIPSPRDVLLVAKVAKAFGRITWIRANLALGASQVTERIGMSCVILAAVLGLITPDGKNRWSSQSVSNRFDDAWIDFENLLLADADIQWSAPVFVAAFNRSRLMAASGQLGWIEASEVSVLCNLASDGRLAADHLPKSEVFEEDTDDSEIKI